MIIVFIVHSIAQSTNILNIFMGKKKKRKNKWINNSSNMNGVFSTNWNSTSHLSFLTRINITSTWADICNKKIRVYFVCAQVNLMNRNSNNNDNNVTERSIEPIEYLSPTLQPLVAQSFGVAAQFLFFSAPAVFLTAAGSCFQLVSIWHLDRRLVSLSLWLLKRGLFSKISASTHL